MQIVHEDLWQAELPVMIVVTTNAIISNGRLVMGAGAAKQAKDRDNNLPFECANKIQFVQLANWTSAFRVMYGFLEVRPWTRPGKAGFGIFQTKRHSKSDAGIDLINFSCQTLSQWIRRNEFACPVRMNFPGIGNGGLAREMVEPILWAHLKELPVTICVR